MGGLFFPGALSQFFMTAIFFAIVSVFTYMGGRIYLQERTISKLTIQVQECGFQVKDLETNNGFLRTNMYRLQQYYRVQTRPVLVNGKLNMENLFNANPR